MFIIFIILILIIIYYIHTYYEKSFLFWKKNNVPYLQPTFPFGNVTQLLFHQKAFGGYFNDLYNSFKNRGYKYGGCYFGTVPVLIIASPNLVRSVLTKDFNHFLDRPMFYNAKRDPLSAHLFTLKGEEWRPLRRKLTPTFSSGKIKKMYKIIHDCCLELTDYIESKIDKNEIIDMKESFRNLTNDVIGACAFGIKCNSIKDRDSEFMKHSKLFIKSSLSSTTKMLISVTMPKFLDFIQVRLVNKKVSDFFIKVLKENIEKREKDSIEIDDFLNLLIKMLGKENGEGSITFNQLAAQAFVFFIAGYDTTSTTLNFCFIELAMNQDVQDKLRSAILEELKKCDDQIDYQNIMEIEYLNMVVNETLRKHPASPVIMRKCTNNYNLPDSDVIIKKGTQVWIPVSGFHNDPEYYPNPEKFDPERFSYENNKNRLAFTYIPFGEGPRNCIGLRFALFEIKICLITILQKYRFLPTKDLEEKYFNGILDTKGILLASKGSSLMKVEKIL